MIKNKYIEGARKGVKKTLYRMAENDVTLFRATENIPKGPNVYQCKGYCLVANPDLMQSAYVVDRVKSLYDYLPETRSEAEYIAQMPREKALAYLAPLKEQYEPKDVYNYLMRGLRENSLSDYIEFHDAEEIADTDADRHIFVADVYVKGKWTCLTCISSGITVPCFCSLEYTNKEQTRDRAMRHFSANLHGQDKQAFDKLAAQSGLEM